MVLFTRRETQGTRDRPGVIRKIRDLVPVERERPHEHPSPEDGRHSGAGSIWHRCLPHPLGTGRRIPRHWVPVFHSSLGQKQGYRPLPRLPQSARAHPESLVVRGGWSSHVFRSAMGLAPVNRCCFRNSLSCRAKPLPRRASTIPSAFSNPCSRSSSTKGPAARPLLQNPRGPNSTRRACLVFFQAVSQSPQLQYGWDIEIEESRP